MKPINIMNKLNESDNSGKIKSFNDAWQEAHYINDKVYHYYWNPVKMHEKLVKDGLDLDELKDSLEKIFTNLDALGEILQKEE